MLYGRFAPSSVLPCTFCLQDVSPLVLEFKLNTQDTLNMSGGGGVNWRKSKRPITMVTSMHKITVYWKFIPAEVNGPFGHPSWIMSTAHVSTTSSESWTSTYHQQIIAFPNTGKSIFGERESFPERKSDTRCVVHLKKRREMTSNLPNRRSFS